MPPAKKGGPLDKKSIETLRLWISEGAEWPNDLVLKTRAKKICRYAQFRRHGIGSQNSRPNRRAREGRG